MIIGITGGTGCGKTTLLDIIRDFGGKVLFENVSFDVNPGEFVGLIGANGTGKTTLFKVITGEVDPTEGGAFVGRNVKVGYLEQHACHGSVRTVYDEALSVFEPLMQMEAELEDIAAAIDNHEGNRDALIERQIHLNEVFQEQEGLTFRSRTRSALIGLGFKETDFYLLLIPGDKPFKTKFLSAQIGASRLSFAKPEHMEKLLGVTPGSATVLSLMHPNAASVRLLIDKELLSDPFISCHPCINTSTLKINMNDILEVFLPAAKHEYTSVELPWTFE